jgi:hyperosmotically inducible periplasmic protein
VEYFMMLQIKKEMRRYLVLVVSVLFFGCKSKDKDIKQSIAVGTKEELMFAGVNYTVRNGVVTLTGNCPGEELKNKMIKRVLSTSGVKNVVDRVAIGPVVLDQDFVLKQKVDSVLSRYAGAASSVKNGVVYLSGDVKKAEAEKLLQSLNKLPLGSIVNNITAN